LETREIWVTQIRKRVNGVGCHWCHSCHAAGHVGNDWVNLQTPEWSRILRAPAAKSVPLGVEMCRRRKARTGYPLVDRRVQPPDVLKPSKQPPWDPSGEVHVSLTSADDRHRTAMLEIIRQPRASVVKDHEEL